MKINVVRVALLLIAATIQSTLFAQLPTVVINNGKVMEGDFFKEKFYMLKSFGQGVVKLKDSNLLEGVVNISAFTQTINVITPEGDTTNINLESMVESVSIGRHLFFKINGSYIQILDSNGDVSLGLNRILKLGTENVEGAYGGKTDNSSVSAIRNVTNTAGQWTPIGRGIKYNVLYSENLFLVKKGKASVVSKRNFQRLFPNHNQEIESFLNENKCEFSNSSDVIKLFKYLIAIQK